MEFVTGEATAGILYRPLSERPLARDISAAIDLMSPLSQPGRRGTHWLRTQLLRLSRWTRSDLINWHEWNDRNGDFREMTKEQAIALLVDFMAETRETPEEMRAGSRRP